ncbi:MAG TPA: glycosyltransferase family 4 protein [Burkholderiales bacterium]|jgi:glycosyltransferase involved in cell wall biosynthesis
MNSPKLSIVHTEASLGWGGQELRILAESKGLMERGHEVRLLCPPQARIFAEAPAWGLPVTALPIGEKTFRGLAALRAWFRKNRCDVISTHSSTDSWLSALSMALLGRPYPIVRTRHISAPVSTDFLTRWLYTRATSHIVTAGVALRKELIERNGFPAARIDSVPTGIDTARFRPGDRNAARKALGLPAGRPLVGIVATLRSWKGHLYLIEAFAGLPKTVHLVVVGDGPMRPQLEARVDKLGLRERTLFAGNQSDVVPWLQAIDIFALPSYANEGVPQALVQAMLAGLACVTTNVGSIAEVATDGRTALVVPPRNVTGLRYALNRLLEDGMLREQLAGTARTHCAANFSRERMLDEMERLYSQAARTSTTATPSSRLR